jgi:hypothetical protein
MTTETESSLELTGLVLRGEYDEGETEPRVTLTQVLLRQDGLPDLDLLPYLGEADSQLMARELQAELDYELAERRDRDGD